MEIVVAKLGGSIGISEPDKDGDIRINIDVRSPHRVYLTLDQATRLRDRLNEVLGE